uniref:DDE Tnp4 domain-containing protein n=1 Tax=Triticum urartu TaxID=4572 RepID=A0A8R7R7N1_TRIUA
MEKIKHMFDKIHGLPNCCGVVHTDRITFGSQNRDHEENDVVVVQSVVDPDMKFTEIWLDYDILEDYERGGWLNGSNLKLSDGSDVGEYIIGDAGYPLCPWLLTPYQFENDDLPCSDSKVEFNRRHSTATAITFRALARLKGTWKCLQGEGWHPNNKRVMNRTINTCCQLHNIVIDMEELKEDKEEEVMEEQEENYRKQVRQVADEDAIRVRDALSQHLIESGVHTMAAEEEQQAAVVASGSGDGNKEQETLGRLRADRGKEKVL